MNEGMNAKRMRCDVHACITHAHTHTHTHTRFHKILSSHRKAIPPLLHTTYCQPEIHRFMKIQNIQSSPSIDPVCVCGRGVGGVGGVWVLIGPNLSLRLDINSNE